jgi:hypothetical protein
MKGVSLFKRKKVWIAAAVQLAVLVLAMMASAGEGKKIATVVIPPAPEIYATEPQPLTVTQCGQCHPGVFSSIKNDGVRHRFDCQKCHTSFHAYNPKKGGWDEIMPKCATCHTEPHGKTVTDCLGCHTNPHAPKKIAMNSRLLNACPTCHTAPSQQLAQFPSKHTKLGCQKCHTTHGYKPTCFDCHKPHYEGQEISACSKCHSVHRPTQVTYDKETPAAACGACHGKVYAKWQKTPSKHGKVNCAVCHQSKHRYVPKCTDCHGTPHKQSFHTKFPNCLTCHLDVHDLPVKQANAKP